MTPERWAAVRGHFHELVDLSSGDRAERLAALGRSDPDLAAEVTSLLATHESQTSFLEPAAPPPSDPLASWQGRHIGPYRVEQVLGQGGMGVAYLARDERLGRAVTIKAVAPEWADDPTRRTRLEREARAAAMLSHPGVAAVYALEHVDGHAFIVSEYVPGRTLRAMLDEGPLPVDRALGVLRQLARGLEAAHARGIVHRDLKPENIMVRDDGVVKVLDFGLAVFGVDGDQPTVPFPRLTATGLVVGTPAYMAPEQLAGHAIDARSDIYAFGVVAYELVTGQHPFADAAARAGAAFEATSTGRALRTIVDRCVEAMPQRRFESARELAEALDALATTGTTPPASPAATDDASEGAVRWWRIHQAVVSALYVAAVALVWSARAGFGARGNAVFLAVVVIASVGVSFRCHLWFVSVSDGGALSAARRSASAWIWCVDGSLALTLLGVAWALAPAHEVLAGVATAIAVSTLIARWRIEPTTARAAFGSGP